MAWQSFAIRAALGYLQNTWPEKAPQLAREGRTLWCAPVVLGEFFFTPPGYVAGDCPHDRAAMRGVKIAVAERFVRQGPSPGLEAVLPRLGEGGHLVAELKVAIVMSKGLPGFAAATLGVQARGRVPER